MPDSRRIMADLRAKMDRIARSVAVDALDSAASLTPVDSGEARGNWRLSVGAADVEHDSKRRAPEALAEGRVAALGFGVGKVATIANSTPYAPALEFGLGANKPAAMVRKTAARVPQFLEAAVDKERGK